MSVFWKGRSEIGLAKLFPSSAGIKEAKLDKYWLALPSWITSSSQCFNNFFGRFTFSPFSHGRRNVKASDGNIQGNLHLNIEKVSWNPRDREWRKSVCHVFAYSQSCYAYIQSELSAGLAKRNVEKTTKCTRPKRILILESWSEDPILGLTG